MSKVFVAFCLVFFFALPAFAQFVDIGWVARYNSTGNREDIIYAMNTDYDYATTRYFTETRTTMGRSLFLMRFI